MGNTCSDGTYSPTGCTGNTAGGGNTPGPVNPIENITSLSTSPASTGLETLNDNVYPQTGSSTFHGVANGILHYWIEVHLLSLFSVQEVYVPS